MQQELARVKKQADAAQGSSRFDLFFRVLTQ
jgi:hypothetical protein